jgi:hypothetical protein
MPFRHDAAILVEYDEANRKKGSKTHMAVDTLGHLLALHVMPAADATAAGPAFGNANGTV